ncbi:MAG: 2-C-methyl-D-erythritol 2,4-cyclodiphosphate synthase [Gammaproteobacteria bacterium]|nr:2-C-methyl-D-erythritol 2,4-cyclodiphosphate synthase [Gammaproteobacteria bacterium]
MRVGMGYDAHRFSSGDAVTIGGVLIPFDKSLAAHSDGDVLLHAICDALLGAAGLGDIGKHFPDSDPDYAGIDSRVLLREVCALVTAQGMSPSNIDATIVAERPRMAAHIEQMRANVAADCGLAAAQVNVKATTTEKMGFAGREEGIAAYAVALIES